MRSCQSERDSASPRPRQVGDQALAGRRGRRAGCGRSPAAGAGSDGRGRPRTSPAPGPRRSRRHGCGSSGSRRRATIRRGRVRLLARGQLLARLAAAGLGVLGGDPGRVGLRRQALEPRKAARSSAPPLPAVRLRLAHRGVERLISSSQVAGRGLGLVGERARSLASRNAAWSRSFARATRRGSAAAPAGSTLARDVSYVRASRRARRPLRAWSGRALRERAALVHEPAGPAHGPAGRAGRPRRPRRPGGLTGSSAALGRGRRCALGRPAVAIAARSAQLAGRRAVDRRAAARIACATGSWRGHGARGGAGRTAGAATAAVGPSQSRDASPRRPPPRAVEQAAPTAVAGRRRGGDCSDPPVLRAATSRSATTRARVRGIVGMPTRRLGDGERPARGWRERRGHPRRAGSCDAGSGRRVEGRPGAGRVRTAQVRAERAFARGGRAVRPAL